jgi:hypothetical protein
MAGYSGTPLPKKLGIREHLRLALINAPPDFQSQLGDLPTDTKIVKRLTKPLDLVLLFVDSEKNLANQFPAVSNKLSSNGMIWIVWPKKSSGVVTDLSFDRVQRIGLACGLVDVKICAIDEVWSGLKFVYRLKDRLGRKGAQKAQGKNQG